MKLINGEALEQLKLIPTKSVDFVCIDPPYELLGAEKVFSYFIGMAKIKSCTFLKW